jgi:hypothetical protein
MPIILTNRSENLRTRQASAAVAALLALPPQSGPGGACGSVVREFDRDVQHPKE